MVNRNKYHPYKQEHLGVLNNFQEPKRVLRSKNFGNTAVDYISPLPDGNLLGSQGALERQEKGGGRRDKFLLVYLHLSVRSLQHLTVPASGASSKAL